MAKNSVDNVVDSLEDFFKKAPALPANWREGLVKVTPWLALIFGVLGVLGALSAVGVLTAIAPLSVFSGAAGVASYGGTVVAAWIWLAASVLLLAAYPGTKARKYSGWSLLFWSVVVNTLGSVVAGELVSAVLGALIGFYFLFQIKSYYK
jgi:hypothetical protein